MATLSKEEKTTMYAWTSLINHLHILLVSDPYGLSHTTRDCMYHLVWIPKCRKMIFYGNLRKYCDDVLRELTLQKESNIVGGTLGGDHFHMLIKFLRNILYHTLYDT